MSKQTAVTWLIEQMEIKPMSIFEILGIVDQAKKLEREQIEKSFEEGKWYDNIETDPSTYYEKTYGGNNESN